MLKFSKKLDEWGIRDMPIDERVAYYAEKAASGAKRIEKQFNNFASKHVKRPSSPSYAELFSSDLREVSKAVSSTFDGLLKKSDPPQVVHRPLATRADYYQPSPRIIEAVNVSASSTRQSKAADPSLLFPLYIIGAILVVSIWNMFRQN